MLVIPMATMGFAILAVYIIVYGVLTAASEAIPEWAGDIKALWKGTEP